MMECRNSVFKWSQTYNSPLEMNKLALVNFTLLHEKVNKASTLVLNQPDSGGQLTHQIQASTHQIQASPHTKLLGILLDSKLTWKAQHKKVCEKVIKWTMAFKHFMKVVASIRMNKAHKLYNAVAVPKITYTTDLWFCPKIL